MSPVGVGVIGADPSGRGFAPRAHLPAIRASEALELLAVCTSRTETARLAAERWNAPRWYAGYERLLEDSDVELVTVSVRVRLHKAIVEAALEAGKAVYCEWPLGLHAAEAGHLSRLAEERGIVCGVGTQGRFSPAAMRARDLLGRGAIGLPLGVQVAQLLEPFSVQSDRWWFAKDEEASGALHVATAHITDLVQYLLGPIIAVAGATSTTLPEGRFSDTGEPFRWTAADTVAYVARFPGGAIGSAYVTNTARPAAGFSLRIIGEEGQLLLTSPGYAQFGPAALLRGSVGDRELSGVTIPDAQTRQLGLSEEDPGFNVGRALTQLAGAMRNGSAFRPDFRDATRLHRVIEAVARSSKDGAWEEVPET